MTDLQDFLWEAYNVLVTYFIPLTAFTSGCVIAVHIDLHGELNLSRKQVYMMSVPVGMVLVGSLIIHSSVSTLQLALPTEFKDEVSVLIREERLDLQT